ncbi:MAG: glycosyltransferase family 2 protein [bacterium]
MNKNYPKVTIIIPVYNEERYIAECLDAVVNQDYPHEYLEALIVDGMSGDNTRAIVAQYLSKYPYLRLLDNDKRFTPMALNIGIKEARGDYIIRMDAHAVYQADYISKCIEYSHKYGADNVGGVIRAIPANKTIEAKAIALSLSSIFGVGGARFRLKSQKPQWVDTVFGGCYLKKTFDRIGLYNENLIRSQDLELNIRLKAHGGKILMVPDIVVDYYPKSTIKEFFRHNIEDGIWAVYPLKFIKLPFKLRHYLPMLFVLAFFIGMIFGTFFLLFRYLFVLMATGYLLVNLLFSLKISIKEKDPRLFIPLVLSFMSRHFGYGIGSVMGLIKLLKR